MDSKEASLYVAKRFFDIFKYLSNQEDVMNAEDPVQYLKDLNKSYYIVNGRHLTDEEIIAFEMSNIQCFLIGKEYDNSKYKSTINNFYSALLKSKVSFQKEKVDIYKLYINIICCLLDKLPPFLGELYERCLNIENRKQKVMGK